MSLTAVEGGRKELEGRTGKVQQVAGMVWVRHHFVCTQGGFVLVLLPFATGQGKGKKSLKKCLGAAEQRRDRALSPLLSGTENPQLPLNFDFIHSHLFQDGKLNTALITEKVGFYLGLFRGDSAVMFWSCFPLRNIPFQGWWGAKYL